MLQFSSSLVDLPPTINFDFVLYNGDWPFMIDTAFDRAVQERAFLRRSARPGSRLPSQPGDVASAWCTCG